DLGQGYIGQDAVCQRVKALTRVGQAQRWTAFEALVASEQRRRDEARYMLEFPHIDSDVESLMAQLGHEVECGRRGRCLCREPPSFRGRSEGEEEPPALRAGSFLPLALPLHPPALGLWRAPLWARGSAPCTPAEGMLPSEPPPSSGGHAMQYWKYRQIHEG